MVMVALDTVTAMTLELTVVLDRETLRESGLVWLIVSSTDVSFTVPLAEPAGMDIAAALRVYSRRRRRAG